MQNPGRWLAIPGFFLWLFWKISFPVGWIEFSLGFSLLVLIPLLLEEAVQGPDGDCPDHWLWRLLVCSLPFSLSGVLSLSLPAGLESMAWASLWLFFTLLVAFGGFWRLSYRANMRMEEFSIDVGLVYLGIGGITFFMTRVPIEGYGAFSHAELIILTLFFHGIAFLLALVTGFFGRYRLEGEKESASDFPYRVFAIIVLVSPLISFMSIGHSRELFIFSFLLYATIIVWMCLWWLWLSIEFKPWVRTSLVLTIFMGFSIVGSSFFKGWTSGGLSGVGMIALIPPYGFFILLLFLWLLVFAWRGVPKRLFSVQTGKNMEGQKND